MSPVQEVILAIGVTVFGAFLYQGIYVIWPDRRGASLIAVGTIGLIFTGLMVLPQYRAYAIHVLPTQAPPLAASVAVLFVGSFGAAMVQSDRL